MKHTQKLKIARRLAGSTKNVFNTKGWKDRLDAIAARVARKHAAAHARAVARRTGIKPKGRLTIFKKTKHVV